MWALDGLAWIFDWAAGRFWDLASAFRGFWIWGWQPLAWAGDIAEGLAIFCWTARDRVHDFDAWIEHQLWYWGWQLQILGSRLEYYVTEWFSKISQLWDAVWGWLRQKAEDAWNKANELWGIVWSTIKPKLDDLSDKFWQLKGWVENTALPEIRLTLYYLKEDLLLNLRVLTGRLDQVRADLDALNPFRALWDSLQAVKGRVLFTFTDGWDKLGVFLTDPPGTIWALLEPILLDRVEQFLNERWDTPR